MKVLVTGGTGFVGTWLIRRLLKDGFEVHALVRSPEKCSELEKLGAKLFKGDITDSPAILKALEGVDGVFHLAGLIAYKSWMRPQMERVNVFGTRCVLEACEKMAVKKFLFVSSVVAIGASKTPNALNEESPYTIKNYNLGYFETKKSAEEIVLEYTKNGAIDGVIVNPSTIYGPEDALKGSRTTQVKVARGKFPFYTSGGVNVIAIEDLIDGIMSAWEKGRIGERYILAGENISIKKLFELIAEEAGVFPPAIYLPNPVIAFLGWAGELLQNCGVDSPFNREAARTAVLYHWFDSKKAQQELGLNPRPAKEAIRKSVQWMKENGILGEDKNED